MINVFFKGTVSERMKNSATSIGTVMKLKMNLYAE
jgi:hypothetical protein|tara:strand:+ start:73 stop:177 length:105 start_codon:yes stop_codon:yes gene_type:complete